MGTHSSKWSIWALFWRGTNKHSINPSNRNHLLLTSTTLSLCRLLEWGKDVVFSSRGCSQHPSCSRKKRFPNIFLCITNHSIISLQLLVATLSNSIFEEGSKGFTGIGWYVRKAKTIDALMKSIQKSYMILVVMETSLLKAAKNKHFQREFCWMSQNGISTTPSYLATLFDRQFPFHFYRVQSNLFLIS